MISHQYKFIYSHIPKAGGTTIENFLEPYSSKTFGNNADKKWLRNKKLFDAFEDYPDYYQFSFTRNPWGRLFSCYTSFTSGCESYSTASTTNCSFFDFVKAIDLFLSESSNVQSYYSNIQNNTCIGNLNGINIKAPCNSPMVGYHALPQVYFVRDNFNFIGKIENFQKDFNLVCEKIGIPQQQLQYVNQSKSKHKHYTEYYDNETRQIVAERYAKDIEYFGYEFGE